MIRKRSAGTKPAISDGGWSHGERNGRHPPSRRIFETENHLPKSARDELVRLLNQHLAEAIGLQVWLTEAHGNVNGPHLTGLHELFDKAARRLNSYVALIAERIRQLGGIAPGTLRAVAANSDRTPVAPANGRGPVEADARRTISTFGTSLRATLNVAGAPRGANPTEKLTRAGPPTDPRLPAVGARSQAPRSRASLHAAAVPSQCSANSKPVKPSAFAAPPGDWLVVIGRLEASVFRSTHSGAAPQCIRAHLPEGGAGVRPVANDQQEGPEHRALAFFEPLASVLHGARRILIFGRVTPLGDETGPFLFWLCNHHPELAERIVDSVPIDPHEISECVLLAKARTCYERTVVAAPPASGSGAADRAEINRARA